MPGKTVPEPFAEIWAEIGTQIQLLGIAGVAGGVMRALLSPESSVWRRAQQGIAGVLSAVFLGGLAVELLVAASPTSNTTTLTLACGFVMGTAGELAVKSIQDRFFRDRDS